MGLILKWRIFSYGILVQQWRKFTDGPKILLTSTLWLEGIKHAMRHSESKEVSHIARHFIIWTVSVDFGADFGTGMVWGHPPYFPVTHDYFSLVTEQPPFPPPNCNSVGVVGVFSTSSNYASKSSFLAFHPSKLRRSCRSFVDILTIRIKIIISCFPPFQTLSKLFK